MTRKAYGQVKGFPIRYIRGHNRRKFPAFVGGEKCCNSCGKAKPDSEFHACRGAADGLKPICKGCSREAVRDWKSRYPEKAEALRKRSNLHQFYGLTLEEYNTLLKRQEGGCAICRLPETRTHRNGKLYSLSVDHEHRTGRVRGLLCSDCNRAIGLFKEDLDRLEAAQDYLRKWSA